MTAKAYNFEAPPAMAIAVGATTPNPGVSGAVVWSTTVSKLLVWSGSAWTDPGASAGVALSVVTPSTVGTTSANGSDTAAARGDHVHAHGVQTDPTLHADASASADGFMTSAQFTRLANVYQRPIFPMTISGGLGTLYDFVLADAERIIGLTNTAGAASQLRVHPEVLVQWPSGTQLVVTVLPGTTTSATLVAGSGVTLTLAPGASLTLLDTMQTAILTKVGTNLWQVDNVRYSSPSVPAGSADSGKVPLLGSAGKLHYGFIPSTDISAGAADAFKFPRLDTSGKLDKSFLNAVTVSAGAGDVGKVALLNSSGKVDASCLPTSSSGALAEQAEALNTGSTGINLYAVPFATHREIIAAGPNSEPLNALQRAFWQKRIYAFTPGSTNSNMGTAIGGAGTLVGMAPNPANSFWGGAMARLIMSTTATANTTAWQSMSDMTWCNRGAGARAGGFFAYFKFAANGSTSAHRLLVGLLGASINLGSFNPSAITTIPMVAVGMDAGDSVLSIFHGAGTGTVTKIPLGASFPFNSFQNNIYELYLYCAPNASTIEYSIRDVLPASPVRVDGSISTNLPPGNAGLGTFWGVGTTTATIASAMIYRAYVETPS